MALPIKRLLLCIGLILIAMRLSAVTISEADFITGSGDVGSWGANSVRGVWARPPNNPPTIFNPDARSWIFWQNNIKPEMRYARVRASAWVYSNVSRKTKLVISDGVPWGGSVTNSVRRSAPSGEHAWRQVVSELTIRSGGVISVAVGYDYHQGGAWCHIGSVKVEAVADGEEFAPLESVAPDFKPELPGKIARALTGEDIFASAPVDRFCAYREKTPVKNAPAGTIVHITTAVNAHEGALFLLRNNSDEVQSFHLNFTGTAAPMVELFRYLYEDGNPDRPQLLPPDGMIEIGCSQTVGIEAVIETGEYEPGMYGGKLRIVPQNQAAPVREYAINIEVLPLELPSVVPAIIGNWDYSSARDPDNLDFLLGARVNLFFLAQPTIEVLKQTVRNLKARGLKPGSYKLHIEDWEIRARHDFGKSGETWLGEIVVTAKDLGLDYKDWILHVYDETFSPEFLKVSRDIKKFDPQVRIFSDHHGDVAAIKKFAPYIDYWSPHQKRLPPFDEKHTAMLEAMRETGKPCLTYECDPLPNTTPANYRRMPYQAFYLKLDGFSYWSAKIMPNRGGPGSPRYGIAYAGAGGKMAPSRRWFHWCAGVEDYLLLRMAVDAGHGTRAYELAGEVLADTPEFGAKITASRLELMRLLQKKQE